MRISDWSSDVCSSDLFLSSRIKPSSGNSDAREKFMSSDIHPFTLTVPESSLADLRERLACTRWPKQETVKDWSQGAPLEKVRALCAHWADRSEEHTSELPSLMRISYAVFCLKKKNK